MLASWIMNTEHLYLVCIYIRVYTCVCLYIRAINTSEDPGDLRETPSQAAKTHKRDVSRSARK